MLSVITINRNNGVGLEKTMQSVLSQTCDDFEYIVVDGDSTDGSADLIRRYSDVFGVRIKWVSEPDTGIYNAMNKGIRMASGTYLEFLNSGDCLVSKDVLDRVFGVLVTMENPAILYGNMLKDMPGGKILRDTGLAGRQMTFLDFYKGTLNHSPAFIRRDLFDKYGFYDESLRIVSDWKWFLQAIIFGGERPVYADIDVSLFDMNGISETNKELGQREREDVLKGLVSPAILADYDEWVASIEQLKRLKRHPWADKLVWLLERSLFKIEKARR